MKTILIQLEELVCPMCATKIEKALKKVTGVKEVTVSYNASTAKLSASEDVDVKCIVDTIGQVGYEVLKIKEGK